MSTGPQLWTVSALAVEFQKDNRTVAKRLEGIEPDVRKGKRAYWYMRTAAPAILGITALDPTQQRAELDAARTRKLALEIDKLEGRLLDSSAVKETVVGILSRVRARLLAMPSAQAGRANPEDPKRAEGAIRDGVYDALIELAEDPFGSRRRVAAAPKANGNGVGGHVSDAEPGVEFGTWEVED